MGSSVPAGFAVAGEIAGGIEIALIQAGRAFASRHRQMSERATASRMRRRARRGRVALTDAAVAQNLISVSRGA